MDHQCYPLSLKTLDKHNTIRVNNHKFVIKHQHHLGYYLYPEIPRSFNFGGTIGPISNPQEITKYFYQSYNGYWPFSTQLKPLKHCLFAIIIFALLQYYKITTPPFTEAIKEIATILGETSDNNTTTQNPENNQ